MRRRQNLACSRAPTCSTEASLRAMQYLALNNRSPEKQSAFPRKCYWVLIFLLFMKSHLFIKGFFFSVNPLKEEICRKLRVSLKYLFLKMKLCCESVFLNSWGVFQRLDRAPILASLHGLPVCFMVHTKSQTRAQSSKQVSESTSDMKLPSSLTWPFFPPLFSPLQHPPCFILFLNVSLKAFICCKVFVFQRMCLTQITLRLTTQSVALMRHHIFSMCECDSCCFFADTFSTVWLWMLFVTLHQSVSQMTKMSCTVESSLSKRWRRNVFQSVEQTSIFLFEDPIALSYSRKRFISHFLPAVNRLCPLMGKCC